MTASLHEAVQLCLDGAISPQVALSRMLLGGLDGAVIAAHVALGRAASPAQAGRELADLVERHRTQLDRLAGEIRRGGSDHSAIGGVAGIAAFFDRAAQHSPEAGVALYSLGDPAILQAATMEIVDWLHDRVVLPARARVLDFGCGIGRIAAALAARGCDVLAMDVSAGMIAEARRRNAGSGGVRFELTTGLHLPAGEFELILIVDAMPYIHQAGLADTIMGDVAAALAAPGAAVVLNLSYGRGEAPDRADAERWAKTHRLGLKISRPFTLWDGTAFVFSRPAPRAGALPG